jgi:hypothetical protein
VTDPRIAKLLLQEKQKRESVVAKSTDLLSTSFPEQIAFIEDPAKFKAALCTRRAGKSYGAGLYLIQEALKHPRCSVLYLALTKDTARGIMVKDIIDPILEANGLRQSTTFNKTTREYTFSNGSKLYLAGADAKPKEMEKVLGQKYALVIIDECASFSQDLNELIEKLIPAVANYDGTIALIGTPSNYTNNFYYEITKPDSSITSWKVHQWRWRDNPHDLANTTRAHDRLIASNPLIQKTNSYKQHWLGEWAIDESALCYRFTQENLTTATKLPSDYYYVLGVDIGWNDDTAFTVMGYSFNSPVAYIVYTFKSPHLTLTQLANHAKFLNEKYHFVRWVIDAGGGGKLSVEEMKKHHDIPWQATHKSPHYKFNAIQLMNADFTTHTIQVFPGNEHLLKEYSQLVWDEHNPTQEKSSCKNHLADATLYAFLACKHYRGKTPSNPLQSTLPPPEPPRYFTPPQINEEPLSWLDYNLGEP